MSEVSKGLGETTSPSVVLFDLDGTLIDTIRLIRESHFHTYRVHFGREPTDAEWLHTLGRPLREQFHIVVGNDEEVEAMVVTYRAYNDLHHDRLLGEYAGAREAVLSLRANGRRLGVVTSKLGQSARRGLAASRFDESWFDVIIGADDVTRHKPAPDPVLAALERLDAAPSDAIYVGDSPHDLVAGRAAGTLTAAVLWGPFPRERLLQETPDRLLETPAEIASL